ncbi:MAG: aa3-type cytochrome c oxidase subunit IV [Sphingomonadales bacterium]
MSDNNYYKSKVASYNGFHVIMKYSIIAIIGTLVLMAIFLT